MSDALRHTGHSTAPTAPTTSTARSIAERSVGADDAASQRPLRYAPRSADNEASQDTEIGPG